MVCVSYFTMEKFADILAAFDAGKLPSHDQVDIFLQWLKNDVVSDGGLSKQGQTLAHCIRDVITAYQSLGDHKNSCVNLTFSFGYSLMVRRG